MDSNFNEVFNIGNPNEITVKQLASEIIKLTNSNSKIIYKNLPKDDPKQRKPDISKAKEKLNWKPEIDLESGLKKTILWINSELNL
jgi:nucleoside-diphosphate-sugar epimerase